MKYPFKDSNPFQRRTIIETIATWYETRKLTRRRRRNSPAVEIVAAKEVIPLSAADLPLVAITHNDLALLAEFLLHYRRLGVSRFIVIDDVSTDGTREFLLQQPDVDLWTSPVRYKDAKRGKLWRETLMGTYGFDRWYVNVDSDEFLVFDRQEQFGIRELVDVLVEHGLKRLPAPMIDMYPAVGEPFSEGRPWLYSKWFDGAGYNVEMTKRSMSMRGGPRSRLFGETNELMKYPLIYWDRSSSFGISIHQPLPYDRNFGAVWGVLLHFKFYVDYAKKIRMAAEEGQHFDNASHYRKMNEEILGKGHLDLMGPLSVAFADTDQLVALGFIPKVPFGKAAHPADANLWP